MMMVKSVTARSKCDKIIIGRLGLYVVLGFPLMLGSAENLKGGRQKARTQKACYQPPPSPPCKNAIQVQL